MITRIALFLAILLIYLSYSSAQTCDKAGEVKLDQTYAKLLVLGGSGRKFPEDKKGQLKKFCDDTMQWIGEIDEYKNRCLKSMPKQVTGIVVYSVRNAMSQYCKRDSKKLTDLITSTPCANAAKKEIDQCYTKMIDQFQGAINADIKLRIPHICCDYFTFLECMKERSLKNKKCDEKKIDVISNFVREIFGNVVDFICGDYTEGSDKCETIGATPKKKKSQRRTKSFMLPMVDSIATLPDA